jgi:hypothetical protein
MNQKEGRRGDKERGRLSETRGHGDGVMGEREQGSRGMTRGRREEETR